MCCVVLFTTLARRLFCAFVFSGLELQNWLLVLCEPWTGDGPMRTHPQWALRASDQAYNTAARTSAFQLP